MSSVQQYVGKLQLHPLPTFLTHDATENDIFYLCTRVCRSDVLLSR